MCSGSTCPGKRTVRSGKRGMRTSMTRFSSQRDRAHPLTRNVASSFPVHLLLREHVRDMKAYRDPDVLSLGEEALFKRAAAYRLQSQATHLHFVLHLRSQVDGAAYHTTQHAVAGQVDGLGTHDDAHARPRGQRPWGRDGDLETVKRDVAPSTLHRQHRALEQVD